MSSVVHEMCTANEASTRHLGMHPQEHKGLIDCASQRQVVLSVHVSFMRWRTETGGFHILRSAQESLATGWVEEAGRLRQVYAGEVPGRHEHQEQHLQERLLSEDGANHHRLINAAPSRSQPTTTPPTKNGICG